MLKYRGTYRVMYETDTRTGQAAEFTFIPCRIRPGANIYRFSDNTLAAYIPGIKTVNKLLNEHPNIFRPFSIGDPEGVLLFNEEDITQAAIILKARVKGKNLSPKPKRKRVLTEEQKQALSDRMKKHNNKKLLEKNSVSYVKF
ncbi:MAG: hypothetical protein GXX00_03175 [Hungateiclostridium thermocellum]|nr:hypothetical protein [Acetivibrio thermocellus]